MLSSPMADADAAPPTPPPEVVAPEENPAATDSAVSAPEEAATAEADSKRKLEEVSADAEANGAGEDAKRPRVDGEDGSFVDVEELAAREDTAAPTPTDGAAMDGDNGTGAPAGPDSQEGDAATDAQDTSRTIQVPSSKVDVLIGKGGETFRNLQKSSGARMLIHWDSDVDSNALTRSVEIVGTLASVDKAEQLVKSVIAMDEPLIIRRSGSLLPGSEQLEMTVPDNKTGLIIGKAGQTIKSIQAKTCARIQLIPQHPPEGVTLTERTVRVTGNKKQIEVAVGLIKQAMDQGCRRSRS